MLPQSAGPTHGSNEVLDMRIRESRFTACNSGQALIETVLIAPFMLTLIFKKTEHHMQLIKLTAASPGLRVGARFLGKPVRARLRTSDEGAQALVEFAVCLPILMLIVTAIFTFGIALHNYLELTDAVSIGARLLAISRGQTTDPCATTATAVQNAAQILNTANITYKFVLNGTTYSGASCSSSSTTTGAAGNLAQGSTAQVTATYPCSLWVYGANLVPSCTLTAQTAELVQ